MIGLTPGRQRERCGSKLADRGRSPMDEGAPATVVESDLDALNVFLPEPKPDLVATPISVVRVGPGRPPERTRATDLAPQNDAVALPPPGIRERRGIVEGPQRHAASRPWAPRFRDVADRGLAALRGGMAVVAAAGAVVYAYLIRRTLAGRERVRRVARRSLTQWAVWRDRIEESLPWRMARWHAVWFTSGVLIGALVMQSFRAGSATNGTPETRTIGSAPTVPVDVTSAAPRHRPLATTGHEPSAQTNAATPRPRAAVSVPPPAARQTRFRGGLTVHSTPAGATVFMNNNRVGQTPIVLASLTAGSRAVRLEHDGYAPWSRSVSVVANQATRIDAVLISAR